MGRDKSALRLGRRTLLARTRALARELGLKQRTIRRDRIPRCGPLGGVYTALHSPRARSILFLPCDMPLLTPRLLREVLACHQRSGRPVFTRARGRNGFPFLLRVEDLQAVQNLIAAKAYSLQELAAAVNAIPLALPKNRQDELLNANTPDDWQRIQQIWDHNPHSSASAPPKMRSKAPILNVEELHVRRSGHSLLSQIDWRVASGQHWAVIGANGSGKTSLLSALTGYLTPTSGNIELLGRRYGHDQVQHLRQHVGLVSSAIRQMMPGSEPALETVVSGKYAMIDLWGRVEPADRAKALQILRQIECQHLNQRPWLHLSQGERQRVLIGRALMAEPKLLILDEPCAGLDPAAREHFLQFLHRLHQRPRAPTLILVTHHLEEIIPAFSHVLILKEGGVLASGKKATVLRESTLSTAFNAKVRLHKQKGRYAMTVAPQPRAVV